MSKDEALKLALEHIEGNYTVSAEEAIAAIKEALAQPEQEPVAWKHPDKNMVFWEDTKEVDEYHGFKPTIPLYTTPPQRTWVDLTDTQIEQAYFEVVQEHRCAPMPWGQVQFGRALLDKFKEVNT